MIEAAEASGELEPGRRLLEPTSGNTGISLALVAKLKGYPLTCVLPENATEERRRLLRLYGAEIVDSPGRRGLERRRPAGARARRARSVATSCRSSTRTRRTRAPTTRARAPRSPRRSTASTCSSPGLGTGGTLMGAGERLREPFPDVVVAAAEPLPGEAVMGLRSLADGYVPPILDVAKLDRKVLVSNEESVAALRELLDTEGIFGGVSAGAVAHVARKPRRRARGGRRRLHPRRRRLEVPLRRLLGRRRRRAVDGANRLVVIPARGARRAARARRGGGAERGVRARRPPRRRRRALRARPQRRRVAVPLRARRAAGDVVPRGRGLRARRLPLAPLLAAAPVAHRRREHRPLAGQALPDPLARHRHARRLDDRRTAGSSRSPSWHDRRDGRARAGTLALDGGRTRTQNRTRSPGARPTGRRRSAPSRTRSTTRSS